MKTTSFAFYLLGWAAFAIFMSMVIYTRIQHLFWNAEWTEVQAFWVVVSRGWIPLATTAAALTTAIWLEDDKK